MSASSSLTIKTLLLSFGRIVASLSTILITVILARHLSVEDFGLHKKALLAFSVCSPALALGLPKALFFFLPGNKIDGRALLWANLMLLAIAGTLFALGLTLVLGDHVALQLGDSRLSGLWWMIGVYAMAMLPLGSVTATLVARDRVGWMVIFQTISQVTLVGLVWSAALTEDVKFTVGAMMIWALLASGAAIVLMLKSTMDAGHIRMPAWSHFNIQLKYAIPLGLASMFGSISTQFDKLMVSNMCSSEAFALYVAGAIELPIIGIVAGAMNAAILPNLSMAYKEGRLGDIAKVWRRAMGKAALLLMPCMGLVMLFAEDVVILLYSESYRDAAEPLMIYACLLPLRCAVYGSVLMSTDKTRWVTGTALVGLITNVCLSAALIQWLDSASGAAWATVISMYAVVSIMLPVIARTLGVRIRELFDLPLLSKIALSTIAASLCVFMIRAYVWQPPVGSFGIFLSIYLGLGAAMYALVGLPGPKQVIGFLRKRST